MGGRVMNTKAVLTKREEEIAELLAWGYIKKEISSGLYISERTVENHSRNIYEKTGVHSIGQLCAWWFCRKYNIPFEKAPVIDHLKKMALCLGFLMLIGVNEINDKASDMVRRVPCRYSRAIRAKRRDDNTYKIC